MQQREHDAEWVRSKLVEIRHFVSPGWVSCVAHLDADELSCVQKALELLDYSAGPLAPSVILSVTQEIKPIFDRHKGKHPRHATRSQHEQAMAELELAAKALNLSPSKPAPVSPMPRCRSCTNTFPRRSLAPREGSRSPAISLPGMPSTSSTDDVPPSGLLSPLHQSTISTATVPVNHSFVNMSLPSDVPPLKAANGRLNQGQAPSHRSSTPKTPHSLTRSTSGTGVFLPVYQGSLDLGTAAAPRYSRRRFQRVAHRQPPDENNQPSSAPGPRARAATRNGSSRQPAQRPAQHHHHWHYQASPFDTAPMPVWGPPHPGMAASGPQAPYGQIAGMYGGFYPMPPYQHALFQLHGTHMPDQARFVEPMRYHSAPVAPFHYPTFPPQVHFQH